MNNPYETRIGELHSLFKAVQSVPNSSYLQSYVYLSQETGALSKLYNFKNSSSTIGKPHSQELARDLFMMESNGYIRDTGTPDSLVLSADEIKYKSENNINPKILAELRSLDKEDLITLSRVVKTGEKFLSERNMNKVEIIKYISDYLLIPQNDVVNNLERFEKIKEIEEANI